jgi:hypothetical protein
VCSYQGCIRCVSDVYYERIEVHECKYAYLMYYRLYQTCIRERIYLSIRIELGGVIELVNTLYYFNIMRIRGVSVAAIKYDNNTL